MKTIIFSLLLALLIVSCGRPRDPIVCVVAETKLINRGESIPDLFVITKDREVIDFSMSSSKFVNIKPNDSIKIYFTDLGFIERVEILK